MIFFFFLEGRPVSGVVRKFKCPLKKTQPFCPCSRAVNWTGKGLKGAQSGTQTGPRPTQELVLGHIMGSRRGHSFILGLHTTIFQAERYAIKVCVMENTENGHKGRNIYVLSYGQAATKA